MIKISTIIASLLFFSIASTSQAEVISITDPRYDIPNSTEGVLRPTRGMTMSLVEQQFGPATEKGSAIGQPPITRWVYPEFNVFFEDNIVIHSVVPH